MNDTPAAQAPHYTVYAMGADGKETIVDARRIRIEMASGEEVLIFLQGAGEGVVHFLSPVKPASEQGSCGRFTPLAVIPSAGNSFYVRLWRDAD